ncbi:hypothetical protein PoB_003869600 [Plakobranchus ocellatus]|uniref:EGF-like domain-containing protein n=1 Tax=Plakobranchus ocellatus TaxID=259542 RepID=A0AAV4AM01_9GAST|nr:hypothetical protein PoB_003869600 [Plakobranchus ocellatus]
MAEQEGKNIMGKSLSDQNFQHQLQARFAVIRVLRATVILGSAGAQELQKLYKQIVFPSIQRRDQKPRMRTSLCLFAFLACFAAQSFCAFVADPCANCVHNSRCDASNTCVCETGFDGDGNFLCYQKQDYHVCKIMSDPTMETFAGEKLLLETFGSARFAELTTGRRTGAGENGVCRFSSTAFTERIRGKIFTKGVTFELLQEDMLGQEVYLEVAVKAEVVEGRYRYAIKSRQSKGVELEHQAYISPDPSSGDEQMITIPRDNCDIVFRLFQGQVLSVNLACCGIRLGVRPFHPVYKESIPGLWIMVKKIFHPRFPFWQPGQQPLCLSPDSSVYNIQDVKDQTGLSDTRSAMSFQALTNPGRHFDTTPDDQRHLADVLKDCTPERLQLFYDESGFILDSPLFINCISGHSLGQDSIVGFLLHAARYYCYGWRWACRCAKQMVLDRCDRVLSDPARFPRVAAFMRQTCDAL